MRTNHRVNTPVLVILSSLVVLLHAASPIAARADPQTMPATALQQACDVPGTPYFTEYFGTVTLDGAPAPVGTVVEAYSPRGDRAGCVEVIIPGFYPYMRVYREDPDANPPIPGMKLDDEVTFKVNGNVAQSDPSPVIWSDDRDQHPVNLSATAAPPAYAASLELSPAAGSYDVGDEFDVDVILDAADYLVVGIDVYLDFDPGKLQVVSFSQAALGDCIYLGQTVDNEVGAVDFSVTIPLGGGEGCLIYDHPQDVRVGTIRFLARTGGAAGVTFDFTLDDKSDCNVAVLDVPDDMLGSVTNGSYGLCYDFNHTDEVDIGDLALIAGAWRATDADSLARYNYNDNNFVDIEDIMTVAKHLGEPCP